MMADQPDIEARARALSKVLGEFLGGGSEWFSRVGDDFYIDPELARNELCRRKIGYAEAKMALARSHLLKGQS